MGADVCSGRPHSPCPCWGSLMRTVNVMICLAAFSQSVFAGDFESELAALRSALDSSQQKLSSGRIQYRQKTDLPIEGGQGTLEGSVEWAEGYLYSDSVVKSSKGINRFEVLILGEKTLIRQYRSDDLEPKKWNLESVRLVPSLSKANLRTMVPDVNELWFTRVYLTVMTAENVLNAEPITKKGMKFERRIETDSSMVKIFTRFPDGKEGEEFFDFARGGMQVSSTARFPASGATASQFRRYTRDWGVADDGRWYPKSIILESGPSDSAQTQVTFECQIEQFSPLTVRKYSGDMKLTKLGAIGPGVIISEVAQTGEPQTYRSSPDANSVSEELLKEFASELRNSGFGSDAKP
jgi:hypothetical protein